MAENVNLTVNTYGLQQTFKIEVTNTPTQIQKLFQIASVSSIIKADGKDDTISVSVMNTGHNPLVGETVQFVTTAGTIAGQNPPTGNSGQSITDANGIARATLTSTNINDTAVVTAFLVSNVKLAGEVKVAFQGVSISLSSSSSNLKTGDLGLVTAKSP